VGPPAVTVSLPASLSTPNYQQNLVILSTGANVQYTVSAQNSDGWLSVTPTAGTTPGTATVIIAAADLTPGNYSGTITITPLAGKVVTVPVQLTVTPPAPLITAVANGASYLPGPVAPGEIVVIYGSAMGPASLATLSLNPSGLINTTLAGTQVFFDDIPAPMVYTSAQQLSAIVPFGVAGRVSTEIKVEYQGLASDPVDTQVVASNPGIFALSSNGQGPGAILNQDYSVNSTNKPAAPDSIIFIYATGGGITNPPSVDGTVAQKAASTVLTPTVQIDGISAEVFYAGAAPFLPAGALQVNARVPNGVRRGASVPVVLNIGPASSQTGITLAVAP